jgi:hypothetical protein
MERAAYYLFPVVVGFALMMAFMVGRGKSEERPECAQLRVANVQYPAHTLDDQGRQVRALLQMWYDENCRSGAPIGPRKHKAKAKR